MSGGGTRGGQALCVIGVLNIIFALTGAPQRPGEDEGGTELKEGMLPLAGARSRGWWRHCHAPLRIPSASLHTRAGRGAVEHASAARGQARA